MTQKNPPTSERAAGGPVGPGRRVVTGFDALGRSTIVLDGPVPAPASFHAPGTATGHAVWALPASPADLRDEADPMESFSVENDWYPAPGGAVSAILTWEPGFQHPMHATDTLDIVFILSGQVELVLENGSTVLGPGECVIQRGTAHYWRVVGDARCTICAVMLGTVTNREGAA